MTQDALHKFMNSPEFTAGEKSYIFDYQFRMGGSFIRALFEAISRADWSNLSKLEEVFPDQVQGFRAWSHGDLNERIKKVTGEEVIGDLTV